MYCYMLVDLLQSRAEWFSHRYLDLSNLAFNSVVTGTIPNTLVNLRCALEWQSPRPVHSNWRNELGVGVIRAA